MKVLKTQLKHDNGVINQWPDRAQSAGSHPARSNKPSILDGCRLVTYSNENRTLSVLYTWRILAPLFTAEIVRKIKTINFMALCTKSAETPDLGNLSQPIYTLGRDLAEMSSAVNYDCAIEVQMTNGAPSKMKSCQKYTLTKHAIERAGQRAVSMDAVAAVLRFGTDFVAKGGAFHRIIAHRSDLPPETDQRTRAQAESVRLVIAVESGIVITVARGDDTLNYLRKKSAHTGWADGSRSRNRSQRATNDGKPVRYSTREILKIFSERGE